MGRAGRGPVDSGFDRAGPRLGLEYMGPGWSGPRVGEPVRCIRMRSTITLAFHPFMFNTKTWRGEHCCLASICSVMRPRSGWGRGPDSRGLRLRLCAAVECFFCVFCVRSDWCFVPKIGNYFRVGSMLRCVRCGPGGAARPAPAGRAAHARWPADHVTATVSSGRPAPQLAFWADCDRIPRLRTVSRTLPDPAWALRFWAIAQPTIRLPTYTRGHYCQLRFV